MKASLLHWYQRDRRTAREDSIPSLHSTDEELELHVLGEEVVHAFLKGVLEVAAWPQALMVMHPSFRSPSCANFWKRHCPEQIFYFIRGRACWVLSLRLEGGTKSYHLLSVILVFGGDTVDDSLVPLVQYTRR